MGLLSGAVSCIRFNVVAMPEEPDFSTLPFRAIQPGSNLRERSGFLPYEPEEPFELGPGQWAFRVRIDKIVLDSTLINERLKELIKVEMENVGAPSPQTRRKLRQIAEDELMAHPMPRSTIIECLMDREMLYLGSTAKGHVGTVLEHLKRIGIEVEYRTPWSEADQEEPPGDLIDLKEPGQSIWGCRFLKCLLHDAEVMVEPEKGNIRLVTPSGARVTLAGPVANDLDRYLAEGCEILAAKLQINLFQFNFDGLSYRLNGLKVDAHKSEHWTQRLEKRVEQVKAVFAILDEKYQVAMTEGRLDEA